MSYNESFFAKLKQAFDKIPVKTRFIKDMNLVNNHTGLRYFFQNKRSKPSDTAMNTICENFGYEYVTIPVKKDSVEFKKYIEEMQEDFFDTFNEYIQKYSNDKSRTYTKKYGETSTVANAVEAFNDAENLDKDFKIDIDELFK